MTIPFRDLDKGEGMIPLGDRDRAVECMRTLAHIPEMLAEIGERPVKSVLLIVVMDDEDEEICGVIAGSQEALELAFDAIMDGQL